MSFIKLQVRRDTAANWTSANPILSAAEIGFETDTGKFKMGNGATAWASLVYFEPGAPGGGGSDTAAQILAKLITVDGASSGLDADLLDGQHAAAFALSGHSHTKLDFLTVTQAVDLDAIEARVNALDAAVVLKGAWAANAGTFPGSGTAQAGDSYIVSVAGTVGGIAFAVNDRVLAIVDNASTSTYANNWLKLDYTDQVLSVNGLTGAVDLSGTYQPLDSDLTAFAGKTAPSGAVVGTSDAQTLSGKTLVDPVITGAIQEDVYAITDGAAFEIDPGNGTIQTITLGANRTPKGTNFAAGESITLMVNDGSAFALTWTDTTFGPSGVSWVGGSAPTLPTTGYGVIVLWKVGSQVYGCHIGNVA